MSYTTTETMAASGLSKRTLAYMVRLHLVAPEKVYDEELQKWRRAWERQQVAQAVTYALLDGCEDEYRETGVRVIGSVRDLDALRGHYMVLAPRSVSIVHDFTDMTVEHAYSVLKLDDVLDAIPEQSNV